MNNTTIVSIGNSIIDKLPTSIRTMIHTIVPQSFFLGLTVSLILGGGYKYVTSKKTTTASAQSTTQVLRQNVNASVKAVGKVTFASEQQLNFNQRGTVTKVSFKEGDAVRKGDIIAEIDKSSVSADIRQAELAVNASSLQLKQLLNDKNKTINDAETDLKTSMEKLPSDIAAAERSVAEKKSSLSQAKLDLEKQQATEFQSLGQIAQSTLTSGEKLLDSYFAILTRDLATRPPSTTSGDYTFEVDHLLYNDLTLKSNVQSNYFEALHQSQLIRSMYGSSLPTIRESKTMLAALKDVEILAKTLHALGENMYALLQGATTDTREFTVSDLQAYRSTVSTNRSTSATLVDNIITVQSNLAAASTGQEIPSITLQQKVDAVTSAENSLKLAEENLTVLKTQTPGALQSKQEALTSVQMSTDTNIALKQNSISQQLASLQKARQALKDYQLVSPFDGIITHLDYKVGDNLLDTGDTEYLMIQNPDFIVVTIPLDQVDVVRIKQGMKSSIVFDAVPDQTFEGIIDSIDSSPVVTSGVVSYDVSVKLPTPKDLTILSGMTAAVMIQTASATNALVVPNLALSHQGSTTSVTLADGKSVPVETGVTDGRNTEILSGLKEGDTIMTINTGTSTKTSPTTTPSPQQIMRLSSGGGDGGFQRGQ